MPKIEKYKDYHHFPFGMLALGAVMDRLGINYDIFDERIDDDPDYLKDKIADYSVVGVSMFTGFQASRGIHWLRYTRQHNPKAITIAGGPHVSALPEQTAASPLVDFAVAGYGENSFGQLIESLMNCNDIEEAQRLNIPGVHSKGVKGLPTPKKYSDLQWGALPYKRLKIDEYINPNSKRVMYVTQYGCPAMCTFCATPETRKWTSKPLPLVYQDLEVLDELTDFKQLCFFDATLFTNRPRTMELIKYMNERFPGRQWLADARASELIRYTDEDYLDIKRCEMDLNTLIVGLESGSEHIAENVVKKGRHHLPTYAEVAKRLNNAGISLTSGVVFGFPEETVKDLKLTHEYISSIRKIHPGFRISTTFFRPLPGTELYDRVKDSGFLNAASFEEWEAIGEGNHFKYNEWMEIPWMDRAEREPYRKAYAEFVDAHGDIMV
jgi:radical SAM superfamily enzyme YgiQ (UPF0313 family)